MQHERQAQRALYDLYADAVYGVCRRLARTPEEAGRFLPRMHGCEHLVSWLTIAVRGRLRDGLRHLAANTCISTLRRRGLRLVELSEVLPQGASLPPTVLEQLATEEITAEIERLPHGYRLVFTLVAIEGFSHAETATALGISESASRSQLTRARAASAAPARPNRYLMPLSHHDFDRHLRARVQGSYSWRTA